MPRDDERSVREAVRAFDLLASALANLVPKLMADLTAPGERLRELDRDPPLAAFSPWRAPDDIADYGGEPAHPPVEVTHPTPDGPGRAAPRTFPYGVARSPGSGLLVPAEQRDRFPSRAARRTRRRSDAARGTSTGLGRRKKLRKAGSLAHQSRLLRSALRRHLTTEMRVPARVRVLADPMSLLDGLAEDALGPMRMRPCTLRTHRYSLPVPEARGSEAGAGSVEGPPVSTGGRFNVARHVGAAGFRQAGLDGGGVDALIGSLVDDLFSPPAQMSDDPHGSEANAPEVADPPEEMVILERSAFAALKHGPTMPSGAMPDEEPSEIPRAIRRS